MATTSAPNPTAGARGLSLNPEHQGTSVSLGDVCRAPPSSPGLPVACGCPAHLRFPTTLETSPRRASSDRAPSPRLGPAGAGSGGSSQRVRKLRNPVRLEPCVRTSPPLRCASVTRQLQLVARQSLPLAGHRQPVSAVGSPLRQPPPRGELPAVAGFPLAHGPGITRKATEPFKGTSGFKRVANQALLLQTAAERSPLQSSECWRRTEGF